MRRNSHHLYYPERDYTTLLEKRFRNLGCLKVQIDVETHRVLHLHQEPPAKPPKRDMVAAIQRHDTRQCGCFAEVIRLDQGRLKGVA